MSERPLMCRHVATGQWQVMCGYHNSDLVCSTVEPGWAGFSIHPQVNDWIERTGVKVSVQFRAIRVIFTFEDEDSAFAFRLRFNAEMMEA